MSADAATVPLLDVRALRTHLRTQDGLVRAVDGVSFSVAAGRTLGIVGESGCGKSVTALSILGLVPRPPAELISGEIWFDGRDLLRLGARALQDLRGDRIAMVFQEPMTSLNPAYSVGEQIVEAILRHDPVGRPAARRRAIELMQRVGIPAPRAADRRLPAPAVGRHAPARHDRDGAGLPTAAPDRRRADDPRSTSRSRRRSSTCCAICAAISTWP